MTDSQQLREAIWDLVYGLLSAEESQAVIARVKSDPEAARMYAEVRLQADLVGQAARIEDPSFEFRGGTGVAAKTATAPVPAGGASRSAARTALPRAGTWLAGIAATALAALLAVGTWWPRQSERALARNYLATDVIAQRSMPAGLTSEVMLRTYFVSTSGAASEAAPASVDVRLVDREGRQRLFKAVQTSKSGEATVEIPGEALEPGVRLEVAQAQQNAGDAKVNTEQSAAGRLADAQARQQRLVATELPVQPEPQVAYFLTAEPTVEADKPVQFSLWNFHAFSATPAPTESSLLDLEGVGVEESSVTADQQQGLVNGTLRAKDMAQREAAQQFSYNQIERRLGAVADNGQFQRARALQRYANTPAGATPEGQPKAGVEGQVAQSAVKLRREQAEKELEKAVADESDRAKKTQLAVPRQQSGSGQALGEKTYVATIAAGQPITIDVPSGLAGKPVLAVAICRGVTVGTTASGEVKGRMPYGNADKSVSGEKSVSNDKDGYADTIANTDKAASVDMFERADRLSIALPPEADGLIEVDLFDRSANLTEPAQRQYVYREPLRKLQIELPDIKSRFAPGEEVALKLQVTDEKGRPAAGTRLGVRVWNEQLVEQAAEQPVLLAEAVQNSEGEALRQDTVVNLRADRQETLAAGGEKSLTADRLSLGRDKEAKPVEESLKENKEELAERVDAFRRPDGNFPIRLEDGSGQGATAVASAEPIELATNRDAVQAALREAAALAEARREQVLQTIGVVAVIGAAVVLVLIGGLALLRASAGVRVLAPAMVAAAASLLVGLAWTGWLAPQKTGQIAMTPAPSAVATAPAANEPTSATSAPQRVAAPTSGAEYGAIRPSGAPAEPASLATSPPALTEAQRPSAAVAAGPELAAPTTAPAFGGGAGAFGGRLAGGSEPADRRLAEESRLNRGLQKADGSLQKKAELMDRAPPAGPGAAGGATPNLPAVVPLAGKPESATAPSSLYFNPQLVTDAGGQATVQFVMPQVESKYRLLIDALGQGRIGSRQDVISCGK